MTDAYLAPIQLRSTTLTLIYSTISLPSWSAGSHQVSCSIGATLGNGGWSTLLNSAKGPLMINGQPPVAPPDIPEERLNLPPIPIPDEPADTSSSDHQQPDRTRPTSDRARPADPAHAGAVDRRRRLDGRADLDATASRRATRSSTDRRRRRRAPRRSTAGRPPAGSASACRLRRRYRRRREAAAAPPPAARPPPPAPPPPPPGQ